MCGFEGPDPDPPGEHSGAPGLPGAMGLAVSDGAQARPTVSAAAKTVLKRTPAAAAHVAPPRSMDRTSGQGRARRTSYAARRRLRGSADPLPACQIDAQGADQAGRLHLAHPNGTVFEFGTPPLWPLDDSMRDAWFDGLPYFLQDLRPAGFMGRQFARAHARALQLGDDPRQWSDDDVLHAISIHGSDQSGNLVVGEQAFRLWLDQTQQSPALVEEPRVLEIYSESASRAMEDGQAGSSTAGEFPKFTALRLLDGTPTRVIVTFSGSDNSPGTQRWSDLLVCEHLAAQTLATLPGLTASTASILRAGNRTFLEVVRFDRHGARGRSALCSWTALNYGWFGLAGRPWTEGAAKLLERALIDRETSQAITRLWHFGLLIANTDMHDGNLSFMPRISAAPRLALAPAYDMLPMLYAPQRGVELPPVNFAPRLPLPAEREAWQAAAATAVQFWSRAADDDRISAQFRTVCADNAQAVHAARQHFKT